MLQTDLGWQAQVELYRLLLKEGTIGGGNLKAAGYCAHNHQAQDGKAQLDHGVTVDPLAPNTTTMDTNELDILSIVYKELMLNDQEEAKHMEIVEVPPPSEMTTAPTEDLLGPVAEDGHQPLIWLPEQNQEETKYQPYGYDPAKYHTDVGHDEKNICGYVEEIEINDIPDNHSSGHTFKLTIPVNSKRSQPKKMNGLLDSGAKRTVISQAMYDSLKLPELKLLLPMQVHGASGESLHPLGIATFQFELYGVKFEHEFIVCTLLHRPIIIGTDFMWKHSIQTNFMDGMKTLIYGECILAEEYEKEEVTPMYTRRDIKIPPRHTAVPEVMIECPKSAWQEKPQCSITGLHYVNPSPYLKDSAPYLYLPDI